MANSTRVAIMNTTDKYFIVNGVEENFTYIGWNTVNIPSGGINIAGSSGGLPRIASMTVEGKNQTVERQSHINGQQIAQQSCSFTTIETYQWKGKTKNKKRALSFPRGANIIWITYAINKYVDITKIKPFKGLFTYKRGAGGRFVIGKVPDAIMTKSINDHLAARTAVAAGRNEGTTTIEEIELA